MIKTPLIAEQQDNKVPKSKIILQALLRETILESLFCFDNRLQIHEDFRLHYTKMWGGKKQQ